MKTITLAFLSLIAFSMISTGQEKEVYIENEFLKAGFLPDVGGRMVFFSTTEHNNLLLADEQLWNEPEGQRISPSVNAPFKPYNGLITWLGPQSEWWSHQELIPSKKGDVWPPDPWLIYGDFQIAEKTETKLVLVGPESPVSGVQLTKTFELENNQLQIKVDVKNIRDEAVSWDIWSNARFSPYTRFEIPVDEAGILKVEAKENVVVDKVAYGIEDGHFVFHPELPTEGKRQRISKAFLYPLKGSIAVLSNDLKLTIEFDKVPKEQLHPEQALVEVYNCISTDGTTDILELEHHSAYTTIAPGKSHVLEETWTLQAR